MTVKGTGREAECAGNAVGGELCVSFVSTVYEDRGLKSIMCESREEAMRDEKAIFLQVVSFSVQGRDFSHLLLMTPMDIGH